MCARTRTHTHTEDRQTRAHNQSIMRSVYPLCMCQQDFEGKALFSLGSKQPPKTNNYIQQIVIMHQKAPYQKKIYIALHTIELINISAAQP